MFRGISHKNTFLGTYIVSKAKRQIEQKREVFMSTTFLLAVGLDWWQLEKHRAAWKSEGYFVISTDSIEEAISYFKDADFDMVLLGRFINHKEKERLTSLIRSTGAQAPVVCIADSSGSSASFADFTLMDESGALLTGIKELLANKAKLRAASAVSYGTAI